MSKETSAQQGKIDWLKIDDLTRDPEINVRPLDDSRAKQISAMLDLDALGIITVSSRTDGRKVILDGQHRVEALRHWGWNGEKIACMVFTGLTREQEAQKFINLNSQRAITFLDRFMSRLTAKEKIACAIRDVARQCGYVIDRQAREGVIVAAKTLEEIYLGKNQKIRGANPKALHGTLTVVTEAWGKSARAVDASVLAGVGAFLLRYGDNIKLDRLIMKMKNISGGPQGLINRGKGKRELHGGTISTGIGHYLTDEYNGGTRGAGRLPAWRE